MGFFSSLFSPSKQEDVLSDKQKEDLKNFDILKYDGVRAQRMGKTDYAIKCFTEALKIQKDFETMKYLMSTYFMKHEFEDALEILDDMVATELEPATTLLTRTGILLTLGRNTEAIADCTKVIEIEPENFLAYFQLAKAENAVGNPVVSIEHLSNAIGIKDDFTDGYMLRSEIYLSLEKGSDALPDIEKVIELSPEDEMAYLLRGRIHELLGDVQAASLDYQQAIELNPFNEKAYLLAGQLMVTQEKYDEAIVLFDEAIEHNEQFAKAYVARGLAKEKKGDQEGASMDIQKSKELSGGEEKQGTEGHNFDDLYKGNII